jgi:hypothetical protein
VNDVSTTPLGLVIAAISVVSSGLQQIMCGAIQAKHKVSSHQLLSNTAPVQVGVGSALELLGYQGTVVRSGLWCLQHASSHQVT